MRARVFLDRLVRQGLCGAVLLMIAVSTAAQVNPLPPLPPGHSLVSMGYYFIDGKFGDHWNEVTPYTNAYYASRSNYESDLPWQADFAASIQRAQAEGMQVTLALDLTKCETTDDPKEPEYCDPDPDVQAEADWYMLREKIDLAQPYWDAVSLIELADEPALAKEGWNRARINRRVDQVVEYVTSLGLPRKPIGLTHQMSVIKDLEGGRLSASALDWVGVSAYLDAPGSPDPEDNRKELNAGLSGAAMNTGSKDLVIVFQAYNKMATWTNLETLVDLQSATYEFIAAHIANRTKGILLFAYARSGGTFYLPELKVPHRWISERLFQAEPPPVAAPSNLQAVGEGFSVHLTWTDNSSNETSFKVQRQSSVGGWSTIGSSPAGSTAFTDGPPPPPIGGSVTYSYRVLAANGSVLSIPSNTATETLFREAPGATPVPVEPMGCLTTVRPTFSWSLVPRSTHDYLAVTQDAVEDFFINRPPLSGTSYTAQQDLDAGVPHRWKVKACNNAGCGPFTPSVYFTPFCAPVQPPSLIDPKGCIGTTAPVLKWSEVAGASGYQVALFQVSDITNDPLLEYVEVPGTSFVPSVPLQEHKEYRFKVKAKAGPASGPYSRHRFFTVRCRPGTRPGTAGPIAPWFSTVPAAGPVNFSWEVAANAEQYLLRVTNAAGRKVLEQAVSATTACGSDECAFTPTFSFPSGTYTWLLRTSSSTRGNGIWGPGVTFTVP